MLTRTIGLALLAAGVAYGCSCVEKRAPCPVIGSADVVFIGKVVAVNENFTTWKVRVTVDVTEWFRGTATAKVTITMDLWGCGYGFTPGRTYLVYAYGPNEEELSTNVCTRTAPIEEATEDLKSLRAPRVPGGRIVGHVYNGQTLQRLAIRSTDPRAPVEAAVAGRMVTAESEQGKYQSITNRRGDYEINGLTPGPYQLSVRARGKLVADPREVLVPAQGCRWEVFIDKKDFDPNSKANLKNPGVISGTIEDAMGRPVKNINVEVVGARKGQPVIAARGLTDARCRFRLKVPPGTYTLSAGTSSRRFFPGVPEIWLAKWVGVSPDRETDEVYWKL